MVTNFKNIKLTEELIKKFKEQEMEAIHFSDYCKLAENLAETYDEYRCLATSIEGHLEDEKMLPKIYKEVDRLAKTFEEYECLAKSIEDNLGDEGWVDKLRKEVQKLKAQARS